VDCFRCRKESVSNEMVCGWVAMIAVGSALAKVLRSGATPVAVSLS